MTDIAPLTPSADITSGLLCLRQPRPWRRLARRVLGVAAWCYLLMLLGAWALLYFGGDRWWFATVMLFAPRWIYGVPLPVMLPLMPLAGPRGIAVLLASGAVLLGPIMGLCLPWQAAGAAGDGRALRVLTANVHGTAFYPTALRLLMEQASPDVVAFQEFPGDEHKLLDKVLPTGWHVHRTGQLVVASRWPISRVEPHLRQPSGRWPSPNALYCVVESPFGPVGVCCVHLHSPQSGLAHVLDRTTLVRPGRSGPLVELIERRRQEADDVAGWLARFDAPCIVAGDLNMPVDSVIYRTAWGAYRNAFCQAGLGFGATKRTPVLGWEYGLRIDHVLLGGHWRAHHAWVAPSIGSDHLPLVAEVVGSE